MSVGAGFYVAGQAQGQDREPAGKGLRARIQDLGLTDTQEAKIADIRQDYRPKVEAAAKALVGLVRDEVEKARGVLTAEQKTKLEELKEERKERRVEGLAARLAHLKELDLTDAELTKIREIRAACRPKIEEAMRNLEGLLTAEQKQARMEGLKAGKKRAEILASFKLTDDQKAKVEAVGRQVATIVRGELAKIRDVLTEEQRQKLAELKEERRDRIRDRMAARMANLKDLGLTDDQKAKLGEIRQEYRPRIHEAGNQLRAVVREEVAAILAALKG
jgi:Spy/CpxP family protein refolding chaperone